MDNRSDEQLLTSTPTDPDAFDAFYRRHEAAVLAYFVRRTRDGELAADLAAETFAAALINARKYRTSHGTGAAWLFGIARHRWLRTLERGKVEDRARRRLQLPPLVIDDDLVEQIERLGAAERAERLLESLPKDQADAVRARVLEDQSYVEISHSIRTSEAVVRKRVSRGLATLRGIAKGSR